MFDGKTYSTELSKLDLQLQNILNNVAVDLQRARSCEPVGNDSS